MSQLGSWNILRQFALAGYDRMNTPILEPVELHERKSGAGIVGKLFELAGRSGRVCLRPELTAGIVRAYAEAEPMPPAPLAGQPRRPGLPQGEPGPARPAPRVPPGRRRAAGRLRRLRRRRGDRARLVDGPWPSGSKDATLRLGHVGLTLEMLGRSGLPPTAQAALVEMLSEAAAEGGDVGSMARGLDHFAEWLRQASGDRARSRLPIDGGDDGGIDRLFRTLVPVINGRREGHEIIQRLRRKWDLGHSWLEALDRVRDQVQASRT